MDELRELLERFISGKDVSVSAANRLEVLLDSAYPDDGFVQERVIDLASYRPGGGDFLLDEHQMRLRLTRLRIHLDERS